MLETCTQTIIIFVEESGTIKSLELAQQRGGARVFSALDVSIGLRSSLRSAPIPISLKVFSEMSGTEREPSDSILEFDFNYKYHAFFR